ncbi:hypothetical protein BS47DRAFT_1431677 [Hydnum rufescens UP504]|uniref:Mitochondrial carrier n=1 Tax=Hydnum rufescens UP504 TaxID=1448309 RepID=A0A9P6AHT1_9AGAM|nr:hypothetical protein BS47DRAFT_1431677 [Hydnum rufescens UP504]
MASQDSGQNYNVRLVGAIAGMGSGQSMDTFDTVKARIQCAPPGTYKGAWDCLMMTVRNESVFALYKGATPPAVGWAAIDAVLLGSLHNYRLILSRSGLTEPIPGSSRTRLSMFGHGVAGLMAGCTSAIVAHPIELLKVKLQLQTQRSVADRQFKGPIDAARQVIKAHGIQGMWRGLPSSVALRSSFFWFFLSVEGLMRAFSRLDGTPTEMSTGFKTFCSGGLSSFTFWFFGIPADNVKNRIMGRPLDAPRISALRVAEDIYRNLGWRGFYRGLAPCFLRAFPVNASALFVYEGLMRGLKAEKARCLRPPFGQSHSVDLSTTSRLSVVYGIEVSSLRECRIGISNSDILEGSR